MPTIEERALETAVEAVGRRMQDYRVMAEENILRRSIEAHARVIAEFEEFKREVSDAASEALEAMVSSGTVAHERAVVGHNTIARFILPKPVDPLAECFSEALTGTAANAASYRDEAQDFCAALAKRGGRIVFKEVGNAD